MIEGPEGGQTRCVDALGRVARREHRPRPMGQGILRALREMISDGEDAEGTVSRAVDRLSRNPPSSGTGRANLLYGEWLRRQGRAASAGADGAGHYDTCAAIGMEAFARNGTNGELLATG